MALLLSFVQKHKDVLLLVGLTLLAWWPISTFLYVPKWDNIDCYLPYRYFIGWAETHGHLPLWNPFQHMGYPAYSDMQNGMYNPFVQLLMMCGGYTSTSLIIELMCYAVLASLGAYQFSGLFVKGRLPRFMAGITYGLSGFMLGTSQIMIFLAGAAFLPFILYHFWLLLRSGSWKNLLLAAFYIALEVTTASPAYTIVLIYVLLGLSVIHWCYRRKEFTFDILKRWGWQLPLLGVILVLLLAPYIISVMDFLPYFGRSNELEYGPYLLSNPFDHRSWFSFLFPYPTLANSEWFGSTDLTMRSAYIGWLPFLFFIFSLRYLKHSKVNILWVGVIVFLILSAGGSTPAYRFIYELPGFGLFRHPSLFRAHLLLAIVVLAAIGMENYFQDRQNRMMYALILSFLGITVLLFIWSVIHPYTNDLRELFSWHPANSEWKPHFIKSYFLLNTVVVLPMVLAVLWILKRNRSLNLLIVIVILDLLLYSQITLPATVYYPFPRAEYETYFREIPQMPDQQSALRPYKELDENYEPKMTGIWRNTATFHKSLTYHGHNQTQFIGFNTIEKNGGLEFAKENPLFYEIAERIDLTWDTLLRPSCLWQTDTQLPVNGDTLSISDPFIGFNEFSVNVENESKDPDLLVLNQNFHKGWSAQLDTKEVKIHKVNDAFMAVEIPPKAKGKVVFQFDAPKWRTGLWIAIISWLFLLSGLIFFKLKASRSTDPLR